MQANLSNNSNLTDLNNKAWEYRYIDREQGKQLAEEAQSLALKNNNFIEFHFSQLTLAQLIFWKTSDAEQLIKVKESIAFFEKIENSLGISRANAICSGMYDQFGQYEKAMCHALNAVKSADLTSNESNKGDCYTLLGQIYSRIHDFLNAQDAFKKGLDIRKNIKEEKAIASSLNLLARNYVLSKKYDEAKRYYEECLLYRTTIADLAGIPWTYLGIASLYAEQHQWELSLEYFQKAEDSNQHQEKRFELLCTIGKGKVWLNQDKIEDALVCFNTAVQLSQSLNIVSLESEIHQLLAEAYEKQGVLPEALIHYKKYNELRQEILSNEKVNMLKQQQIAFSVEHAEKEAEIHRLKNVELKNAFDKIALQHNELEEKSKEITDSITYAKRIQDAYLPEKESLNKIFENAFLLFKPKDIVSGDFYWFINEENSTTTSRLFAAADCTGHGVPGAIMSVICCNALNEVATQKHIYQPDLILNEVRDIVTSSFKQQVKYTQKDGMDISLVRLITSNEKISLQYAGANNPLWIIRKGKPTTEFEINYSTETHYLIEIKADKQPIGNYEVMNPFTLHEMDLKKDDTLYSFSDGLADQFGGAFGKKLKSKFLKELLLSIQQHSMAEQQILVDKAYTDWKNNFEQVDDVCIIGVRI